MARTASRVRRGDLDQHLVARRVAQAVVDPLEVVEVGDRHGVAPARFARQGVRVAQAVGEQGAVGEPGERIVERAVEELLLEALALADVAQRQHDARHLRIGQQVGGHRLHRQPAPAVGRDPQLAGPGHPGLERGMGEEDAHPRRVVGMDDVAERLVRQGLEIVRQQALRRRRDVGDAAVLVDHGDQVRSVLHQRAEARLAAARGGARLEPDVVEGGDPLAEQHQHGEQHRAAGERARRHRMLRAEVEQQDEVAEQRKPVGQQAHAGGALGGRSRGARSGTPRVDQRRGAAQDVTEHVGRVVEAGEARPPVIAVAP
jgi:hypothetical protein